MDNEELLSDFLEESFDLIEKIRSAVGAWVGAPEKEKLINDIYRWVHTIKGGCAVFNFKETAAVAHALETRMGELRKDASMVTSEELAHLAQEIERIDASLRAGDRVPDAVAAMAMTSGSDRGVWEGEYFTSFYEDSSIIVDDMFKDGFTFFEILPPASIASKVKAKLEEHGIFSLQEEAREDGVAHLMFVDLTKAPELRGPVEGVIEKFQGRWCLRKEDPRPMEVKPTPATAQVNGPQGEVLRVPLASVNSILEHIWELFLLHNQISHLMKQNAPFFRENPSFVQQFEVLDTMVERNIQELESKTMGMRMSPLKKVFDRMSRVVEDYCGQSGKRIEFHTSGEGIDLDKKVLDTLNEPLIHLIRNAIDHGVEDAPSRRRAGKPEAGRVELLAQVSGNEVNITIRDDGKGIDPQRILESAKHKGLETSHLRSEQEIIELIFEPGFSTAEAVSSVSGRGVGMDAVRKSIKELGGEVQLNTKVGEGTTFTISLPLSMSVSKSLVVKVRDLQYAFSTKSILFVEKTSVHKIQRNGEDEFYLFDEDLIPCYDLGKVLPDHRRHPDLPITMTHVCVVAHEGRQVAFRVDEIVQTLNVVMRPMPRIVPKDPLLSGVSVLPDGSPIFVLNVFEAISLAKALKNGGSHGKNVA